MTTVTFKTSDNREVENPGAEIWKMARRMQALNPALTFAAARDVVMSDEPVLARAWLNGHED
jgi:hypothetical protein